jgi:hypothetical protein
MDEFLGLRNRAGREFARPRTVLNLLDATSRVAGAIGWTRFVAAFLAVFVAGGAVAGDLRSAEGRLVATVSHDAQLRDASGRLMLRFESDGDVRDAAGRKVFSVSERGQVRTPAGVLVGTIAADGTVRDQRGKLLGRVEPDGDVRDAAGRKIGSARNVRRSWAALYFFFR